MIIFLGQNYYNLICIIVVIINKQYYDTGGWGCLIHFGSSGGGAYLKSFDKDRISLCLWSLKCGAALKTTMHYNYNEYY